VEFDEFLQAARNQLSRDPEPDEAGAREPTPRGNEEPVGDTTRASGRCRATRRANAPKRTVLDIKLRDGVVYPVAEALWARGLPFVFTTGYNEQGIPDRYKDVARYEKPFDPAQVARALFRMRVEYHSPYGAGSAPAAREVL
jgi:hypothetical protein